LSLAQLIARLRLLSSLSRNWLVVSQGWSARINVARSRVMSPPSTVSTQTRSKASANRTTSGVPSKVPRYFSPRVQAKIEAIGLAAPPDTTSESGEGSVQRRTRPHRRRCLSLIGQIIAASIHRLTLRGDQLSINLGLVGRQRLRQRFEAGCQCRAVVLPGQRLCPIQRQVEMGATIIQFANSPRRRTVVLKDLAVGLVERLGQHLHVLIPACLRQMFQRS